MTRGRVVMFPDRGSPDPVNAQGITQRVEAIRAAFIEAAAGELFEGLMNAAEAGGFDLSDDSLTKDQALVYTALVSILNKTRGLDHPMQSMAEAAFVENNDGTVFFADPEEDGVIIFTSEGIAE